MTTWWCVKALEHITLLNENPLWFLQLITLPVWAWYVAIFKLFQFQLYESQANTRYLKKRYLRYKYKLNKQVIEIKIEIRCVYLQLTDLRLLW